MGFLQTLIHDITGHGGQPQGQAHPQIAQQVQQQQGNQLQVQPLVPNHGVMTSPHLSVGNIPPQGPNLGVSMHNMQGNRQNPGFVPLQSGGQGRPGSNPYATGMQPAMEPHWQNFGAPQNLVNPQLNDNGYFYDN